MTDPGFNADFSIPRGRLLPFISGQATDINGPIDLTSASGIRFQMRPSGSSVLKVDAAAVFIDALTGRMRYEWQTADVDTPGLYLAWFEVTSAGKTFQIPEPPMFVEVSRSRDA